MVTSVAAQIGVSGPHGAAASMGIEGIQALIEALEADGYDVYGPRVDGGVITHGVIRSTDDLPVGWRDVQAGGSYRLEHRDDTARFGYAVGPDSWKELLHPARTPVWTMTRTATGELNVRMDQPSPVPRAFLGVRPCELAAIAKQDRVLLDGPWPDPHYQANRFDNVVIAVNCASPAATCFCSSMDSGPAATDGFDLAITEVVDQHSEPTYLIDIGTERGADLIERIDTTAPQDHLVDAARSAVDDAARQIVRHLHTEGIRELLHSNLESSEWDAVAERCLTCANCTLVCPTCFCTDLEDLTDLSGDITDRWRVWDSCFSLEFSHLGDGPHRSSAASRYRQWLVHKLASWIDQFDESGCVGCGRCITWCPVGIDLTAQVDALRRTAAPADPDADRSTS